MLLSMWKFLLILRKTTWLYFAVHVPSGLGGEKKDAGYIQLDQSSGILIYPSLFST